MNKTLRLELIAYLLVAFVIFGIGYSVGHAVIEGGVGGDSNFDAIVLDTSLTTGTTLTVGTSAVIGTSLTVASASATSTVTINGVTFTPFKVSATSATTTPWAVQAPSTGTSTLIYPALNITVSTTSDLWAVVCAKASTRYATTTVIATSTNQTARGLLTLNIATTSQILAINSILAVSDLVFGPSEWLVCSMQGQSSGTFSPTGNLTGGFKLTN